MNRLRLPAPKVRRPEPRAQTVRRDQRYRECQRLWKADRSKLAGGIIDDTLFQAPDSTPGVEEVRDVEERERCCRCWEEGHVAAKCKGRDRTKLCLRCGKEEHQVKSCGEEEAYCPICEEKGHRADTRAHRHKRQTPREERHG
ncbi:hypothetical protein NQ318_023594 [Aromia moschata]|uniref:CCHC-type domain-containing protein n=1 Tax=Aromia moschata TaxID=1265417 RepID=A0AAV8YQ47_9CUCU|nr:hypothetical protein NQ318_023594 [Aromia moschata]